jgi:hypothetical protein
MNKSTIWDACRQLSEELNRDWRSSNGGARKNFTLAVVAGTPSRIEQQCSPATVYDSGTILTDDCMRIELRCLTSVAYEWGRARRILREGTIYGYPIEVVPPAEHEV